jgi:hypothetical protein
MAVVAFIMGDDRDVEGKNVRGENENIEGILRLRIESAMRDSKVGGGESLHDGGKYFQADCLAEMCRAADLNGLSELENQSLTLKRLLRRYISPLTQPILRLIQ